MNKKDEIGKELSNTILEIGAEYVKTLAFPISPIMKAVKKYAEKNIKPSELLNNYDILDEAGIERDSQKRREAKKLVIDSLNEYGLNEVETYTFKNPMFYEHHYNPVELAQEMSKGNESVKKILVAIINVYLGRYISENSDEILIEEFKHLSLTEETSNSILNKVDEIKKCISNYLVDVYKLAIENNEMLKNIIERLNDLNAFDNLDSKGIEKYYENVLQDYTKVDYNSIMGPYSLKDSYIEPKDEDGNLIIERIDDWYNTGDSNVLIIHGEPGHGKTSLCQNAVYEFMNKDSSYFKENIKGVYYFSLNPSKWNLINKTSVNGAINETLNDIQQCCHYYRNKQIDLNNEEDIIIFLDGYDELKNELIRFDITSLKDFIQQKINIYANDGIKFVITTRTNAILSEISNIENYYDLIKIAGLKKEEQDDWVKRIDQLNNNTVVSDTWKNIKNSELYDNNFKNNDEDEKLNTLLAIPILFRILVVNKLELGKERITKAVLYEKIFETTMLRDQNRNNYRNLIHQRCEYIMFKLFQNDEATTLLNNDEYTLNIPNSNKSINVIEAYFYKINEYTDMNSMNVSYLHKSFYEYFVAYYLIRKIYKVDTNVKAYLYLNDLCYRKISNEIYDFMNEIQRFEEFNGGCKEQYKKILEELVRTKGIIKNITVTNANFNDPLEGATNVFHNCINTQSKLNLGINLQDIGEKKANIIQLMRTYDCTGLLLNNQNFIRVNFSRMTLKNVNFCNSKCFFCKFNGSDLRNAIFVESDLTGSRMIGCNLTLARFEAAIINFVDLRETRINPSNIEYEDVEEPDYGFEQFANFNQGIKIGRYYNEEIVGRALDYDKDGNLLVITEKIIDSNPYNRVSRAITWKDSDIRKK